MMIHKISPIYSTNSLIQISTTPLLITTIHLLPLFISLILILILPPSLISPISLLLLLLLLRYSTFTSFYVSNKSQKPNNLIDLMIFFFGLKNAEASELPSSKGTSPPRSSSKRGRAAEFHNLSEKVPFFLPFNFYFI